ncbi:MAG: hypothetical protein HY237_06290 [Acidobacteria bacterium]|nr:hypothetical protein [Acidobacteriota bacterium]
MKHFEITQWADFVRGAAGKAEHAAMETHLSSGCRKCRKKADLLRLFATIATSEAQYQVPQYAIHCARAIFALQQPEKVHILPRILARPLYDSFREPLPAGVRTQQRLSRQALYEAGDFRLDLRLEHERGSPQVSLVGQIENRKEPNQRVANVPVLLAAGKKILARTVSNQFGEFHLDYHPRTHLRLYVPVLQDHARRIEVPLSDLQVDQRKDKGFGAAKPASKRKRKK